MMAARLIIDGKVIEHTEWHPLDGVPAPEYIPPHWIGPHVGLRLVEAFKTLARMPTGAASTKSGLWPDYRHEWTDLMAQVGSDADVIEQTAKEQNRARLMPSAQDVSRMERAIVWPGRYLKADPVTSRLVLRVALHRSRDLDLEALARKLRRQPQHLRLINREGLDIIASGLRKDRESVF